MKFEKHSLQCPQLRHEYKVCQELQECERARSNIMGPTTSHHGFGLVRAVSRRIVHEVRATVLPQNNIETRGRMERCEALHGRHLIHRT